MSAAIFNTAPLLTADLHTLGYPDAQNAKCLLPDGPARLALLVWLAQEIDPTHEASTTTPPSTQALAAFWNNLGVHSAPPLKLPTAGKKTPQYHIPLTAPNRPRDKAAARVFLRAAIDITLAIRRQRQITRQSNVDVDDDVDADVHGAPPWLPDETAVARTTPPTSPLKAMMASSSFSTITDDTDEDEPPAMNDFDITCFSQLDALLAHRHTLFPSTNHLFSSTPTPRPKRPPLSQRSPSSPNITRSNSIRSSRQYPHKPPASSSPRKPQSPSKLPSPRKVQRVAVAKSASRPALPTVDVIRKRIVVLNEHTAELQAAIASSSSPEVTPQPCPTTTGKHLSTPPSPAHIEDASDDDTAAKLAETAHSVTKLSTQLQTLADEARAVRHAHGRTMTRDETMEKELASRVPKCKSLAESVMLTVTAVSRVREALLSLRRGQQVLQSLPGCPPVRAVVRQQKRTECHL